MQQDLAIPAELRVSKFKVGLTFGHRSPVARAFAEYDGLDVEPVVVGEVTAQALTDKRRATLEHDVAGLLLATELREHRSQVAMHDPRVLPVGRLETVRQQDLVDSVQVPPVVEEPSRLRRVERLLAPCLLMADERPAAHDDGRDVVEPVEPHVLEQRVRHPRRLGHLSWVIGEGAAPVEGHVHVCCDRASHRVILPN